MSDKEERSPALEALFAAIERHPPLFHQRSSILNPPDSRPSGAVYYVFDVALTEQDDAMVMHGVSRDILVPTTPPARTERPSAHTDLPTPHIQSDRNITFNPLLRSIEREIRDRDIILLGIDRLL